MPSSDLIRWCGLATMGGGGLFIVYSLLGVAIGKGDEPGPLDLLAILAYVFQVVGLLGFHTLQGRNYGRIGRAGLYTTIGAIVLWEFLILASLLGGRCRPRLACRCGGIGHAGRTGAVRRSYSAGEGSAALVRDTVHPAHARYDPVRGTHSGRLLDHMGGASLGGAGIRTLVAEQWRSRRATFACKVK